MHELVSLKLASFILARGGVFPFKVIIKLGPTWAHVTFRVQDFKHGSNWPRPRAEAAKDFGRSTATSAKILCSVFSWNFLGPNISRDTWL